MILSGIRKFMSSCPHLADGKVNIDFLSETAPHFGVYAENADPVVRKYTDGSCLMQFVFSFRMRAAYGLKTAENEKISTLFENVSAWITAESEKGSFPDIGESKDVQKLEIMSQGHIKNTNAADCVYEMKCRILYYKRR